MGFLEDKTAEEMAEYMSHWISCFKCPVKDDCLGQNDECADRLEKWLSKNANLERITKTGYDGLKYLMQFEVCDRDICPLYEDADGICDCRMCFRDYIQNGGARGGKA